MIADIQSTMNGHQLQVINQLWKLITFPESQAGRVEQAIIEYTAQRLMSKQVSRLGKNPKKDFTFKLKFFEAVILERKVREVIVRLDPASFEYMTILHYCNQLHQQTQ